MQLKSKGGVSSKYTTVVCGVPVRYLRTEVQLLFTRFRGFVTVLPLRGRRIAEAIMADLRKTMFQAHKPSPLGATKAPWAMTDEDLEELADMGIGEEGGETVGEMAAP
jgi:hypothetical protein